MEALKYARDMAQLRRDALMPVVDVDVAACAKLNDARVPDEAREMIYDAHCAMNGAIGAAGCVTYTLFLGDVVSRLTRLGRGQTKKSIIAEIQVVAKMWSGEDKCGWADETDAMVAEFTRVAEFKLTESTSGFAAAAAAKHVRLWLSREPPSSSNYQQASVAEGQTLFLRKLIERVLKERSMSIFTEFQLMHVVRTAVRSVIPSSRFAGPAFAQQVGFIMVKIVEIYDEYERLHRSDEDVHRAAAQHCCDMMNDGLMKGFKMVSSIRHCTSRSR